MDLLRPTKLKRTLFFIIADSIISYFAFYFAFLLRFSLDLPDKYLIIFYKTIFIFIFIRIFLFFIFKLYKIQWRYFNFKDQSKLFYINFLSTLIFYCLASIFRDSLFYGFPRSILALEFFISIFLITFIRAFKVIYLELLNKNTKAKEVIIIGTSNNSESLIRELLRSSKEFRPRLILDTNKDKLGTYIHGLKVCDLDKFKNEDKLQTAIIPSKNFNNKDLNIIYEKLLEKKIKDIKIYNDFNESKNYIKNISLEDLLARKPKDLDKKAINSFIKNKVILITGAGGSIGSELVRQCLKYEAKKIILLDHSEYSLYKIYNEMENENLKPILQSVSNLNSLENTFIKYKPQIVIHAAAYKHVPLVEENVDEAIYNNIIGTKNCIDLAIKYEASNFVLISTDKAVNPTNVMGATKRVCELYAQNVNAKNTNIVAVRFGNVLGSSGSVIPLFKRQIKNKQNLEVTHKDVTRYFMLVNEACELVLQAASMGKSGEIFVLNMGKAIKILDLAKKMIELSGNPKIGIDFIGLRKGEKLHEELFISGLEEKTKYNCITITKKTIFNIEELNNYINSFDKDNAISILKKILKEFKYKD